MLAGLILCLQAASAAAAAFENASTWSDDFIRLNRMGSYRHVVKLREGGVTISDAEQSWSLPSEVSFSSGTFSGSVVVGGKGSGKETVSLWRTILVPGKDYETLCPGEGPGSSRIHRMGKDAFPLGAEGAVAGWGPAVLKPECREGENPVPEKVRRFQPGILARTAQPLRLSPGCAYAFCFLVSTGVRRQKGPVMSFDLIDERGGKASDSAILEARDISGDGDPGFEAMTKQTLLVEVPPEENECAIGFRVTSHAPPGSCFMMGPVYLTAQEGVYKAPVLDSLSSLTSWRWIEYSFDQNQSFHSPDCACSPGSPVTPAILSYGLADSEDAEADRSIDLCREEFAASRMPEGAAGRYMAISVRLYGRAKAALVDPSLAPGDPQAYFSGLTPVLRSIRVKYFARAAEVVSPLIFPPSIRKWAKVAYGADVPAGTRVTVDVISADGTPIVADIPEDYVPGSQLDVYRHQAIRLRARLYDDPNDRKRRPVLKYWRVSWEKETGRLSLRPSAFSPAKGEYVEGLVYSPGGGRVSIRVYDAEGRPVRDVLKGEVGGGSLPFTWNGLGNDGKPVPAGEYFITSTSREGAATRKVRVKE